MNIIIKSGNTGDGSLCFSLLEKMSSVLRQKKQYGIEKCLEKSELTIRGKRGKICKIPVFLEHREPSPVFLRPEEGEELDVVLVPLPAGGLLHRPEQAAHLKAPGLPVHPEVVGEHAGRRRAETDAADELAQFVHGIYLLDRLV